MLQIEGQAHEHNKVNHDGRHDGLPRPAGELSNDEPEEHDGRQGQRIGQGFPVEPHDESAHNDEGCEDVAELGDEVGQAGELLVEGCFHAVVNLCGLEHLSLLGAVAHGEHAHDAVSLHHLRAFHHVIGGIGGVGVEVGLVGALGTGRLACESALVHAELDGLQELAVGGCLTAGVEHHDVAHHHVAPGHLGDVAAPDNFHRLVVVDLVEHGKFLVGLQLEIESQARGEEDGHEDAHRLEEHLRALAEREIFVDGDTHRQYAGNQQDDDERIAELIQKLFPQWGFRGWSEHVGAMLSAALNHFGLGEPHQMFALFHIFKKGFSEFSCRNCTHYLSAVRPRRLKRVDSSKGRLVSVGM